MLTKLKLNMQNSNAVSHGVWGLRISRKIQVKWWVLAVQVDVPVSRLIEYVLEDWFANNTEVFGESERGNLRKAIVESHRGDDDPKALTIPSTYTFHKVKINVSIRNVGIETKSRLKMMAAHDGIKMNQFLE